MPQPRVRVVMAPGWERLVAEAADRNAVGPLADDIAEDAGRSAPRKTGALSGSYGVVKPRLLVRHVGSSLEYADFVERGTDPHEIRPRLKRALWWPGAAHPVRRVQHPGTRAQPHLRPAAYTQRDRPRSLPGGGV
jgi:hypothetical protein